MKYFLNAVVILFSLCIAVLIAADSVGIGVYATLILIDYVLILCLNPDFRKTIRNSFRKNKTFGSGNKIYGEVHLHSLKEDIEQMEPIPFEHFVGDLFAKLGYKTKVTASKKDFGGDVVAKKAADTTIIQVKHRNSSDWSVSNDAVQQAVAAMPVYKANKSMVVTNGEFTEHAYNQAKFSHTIMIDGKQLMNLVRQVMIQESGSNNQEEVDEEVVYPISNEQGQEVEIKDEDQILTENTEMTTLEDLEKQRNQVLTDTIPEVILEEQSDASNS